MISAEQLLAALEKKGFLPPKMVENLRKQVAQPGVTITAALLVKRLVDKGLLTPDQARQALGTGQDSAPASISPASDAEDLFAIQGETPSRPAAAEKVPAPGKPGGRTLQKPADQPVVLSRTDSTDVFGLADDKPAAESRAVESPTAAKPAKSPQGAKKPSPLAKSPVKPKSAAKIAKQLLPIRMPTGVQRWVALGGGLLLLALLIFGVSVLMQPAEQRELKAAEAAFQTGNWASAAEEYGKFLTRSPRHAQAGQARVRRGLCQLREALKGKPNWPEAAKLATQVMADIATEPAVAEVRPDLGQALAAIAGGLSALVHKSPSAAVVAQTRQVLELIGRYIPRAQRDRSSLLDDEVIVALAERQLNRDEELGKAVTAIQQTAAQGQPQNAYTVRLALVKAYPELMSHAQLRSAMQSAAQAEKAAVKPVQRQQAALHDEGPGPAAAAVAFAVSPLKSEAPGVAGQVLVVHVSGAALALDAAHGKVLWQRSVGPDDVARAKLEPASVVSDAAGKAAILLDAARNEVLRVDASSGRLAWRHPLGEAAGAGPLATAGKVFVPLRSGLLIAVDLATGESASATRFVQPLRTTPAADPGRPLIYQLGEQQNLYVVSAADGACKQVVALEHPAGAAGPAPVIAGHALLVVVNDRLMESTLHVLAIGADDSALLLPRQRIRLAGHVDVPPCVVGGRVAVATDRGAVSVFELAPQEAELPLKKIAELPAAGLEDVVRFPIWCGQRWWLADHRLTACNITSDGRLTTAESRDAQSTFQQPIAAAGNVLFHTRQRDGVAGVIVTALDATSGKTYWETSLGAPQADAKDTKQP